MKVIIISPSLNTAENVSGVSSVTRFVIENNPMHQYTHFELGKKDSEKGGWRRIGATLRKLKEWKKLLSESKEPLIHYNFPLSAPSILRDPLFIKMARKMGCKMVIHVHGGVFLNAEKIPFILNSILKWVFDTDEPIIVLSEVEKQKLITRYGDRNIIVLPNCIDLKEANTFERTDCDEPLHMGYLGRIAETKGMWELLSACKKMKENGTAFHLSIAGKEELPGQFVPLFEKEIGENFTYCGVVSGKEKDKFLRSINTFVLPSYFEGLPISLLESMSYGCVPIVTPVGSIPTVVSNGETGIFIKMQDADSIVKAVENVNADKVMMRKISMQAKQKIFEDFNPTFYINKLNAIYSQANHM